MNAVQYQPSKPEEKKSRENVIYVYNQDILRSIAKS